MRSKDTGQQQRGEPGVTQHVVAHQQAPHKGNDKGHPAEEESPAAVAGKVTHIHLQSGQEHDVVDAHLAKEFETAVAFKHIKAMLAYQYTGQYQSDNVRDTQPAQQHGGEQNHGQHKEKNPCGVSNRQLYEEFQ